MRHACYRGLIERDADEPGRIRADSIADHAASRLCPQSPWTQWRAEEHSIEKPTSRDAGDDISAAIHLPTHFTSRSLQDEAGPNVSVVHQPKQEPIAAAIRAELRPEANQVARCLDELAWAKAEGLLRADSEPSIAQISRHTSLPTASVTRALRILERDKSSL